jgi:hypothetical protein
MMTSHSYQAAGRSQLDLLARAMERADTHGYFAVIHGLNKDARSNQFIYSYFAGGLENWIKDWGVAHGRRCIVLHLHPMDHSNPTGDPMNFSFRVPKLKAMRAVNGALALMSKIRAGRYSPCVEGTGILTVVKATEYMEYRGENRASLDVVASVLETYRSVLTSTFRHNEEAINFANVQPLTFTTEE